MEEMRWRSLSIADTIIEISSRVSIQTEPRVFETRHLVDLDPAFPVAERRDAADQGRCSVPPSPARSGTSISAVRCMHAIGDKLITLTTHVMCRNCNEHRL